MNKSILEKLCTENKSSHEMASELGVSQTKIMYWLNKYELKTSKTSFTKEFKEPLLKECLSCKKVFTLGKNRLGKYCSAKCKASWDSNIYIERWSKGLETGCKLNNEISQWVRNYLLKKYNYACVKCSWSKRHPLDNKPLVQINHIDGDSSNCKESNLEVICPNCHTMTFNYGSRNKVSSRTKHKQIVIIQVSNPQ